MNPNRRVVNTFDTFCVIEAAQEHKLCKRLLYYLHLLLYTLTDK